MLMNKVGIAYLHNEELGLPLGLHVKASSEMPYLGIRNIRTGLLHSHGLSKTAFGAEPSLQVQASQLQS